MSSEYLTQVELDYRKGVRNYRLLFGHPVDVVNRAFHYGVTNQIALFRPGALFGLDLWECNEYGTTHWLFYVLQAAAPGQIVTHVPQVTPGALVLLEARGVARAKAALQWLAEVEKSGDPALRNADYFLAASLRLTAALPKRKQRRVL